MTRPLLWMAIYLAPAICWCTSSYRVSCSAESQLGGFSQSISPSNCAAYTQKGMRCGDTALASRDPTKIQLNTPVDNYYSMKNSGNYDRGIINQMIHEAVQGDMDPYLLMALVMVESPPVDSQSAAYLHGYGMPPLDAVAGAAGMNCHVVKSFTPERELIPSEDKRRLDYFASHSTGFKIIKDVQAGEEAETISDGEKSTEKPDRPSILFEYQTSANLPVISAKPKTFTAFPSKDGDFKSVILNLNAIVPTRGTNFSIDARPADSLDCKSGCCAELRMPKNYPLKFQPNTTRAILTGNEKLFEEIRRAVGYEFIRLKIEGSAGYPFVKSKSSPLERLATQIQGYNGYGVFGKSEHKDNDCLNGNDMKKSPIYGAGVGELMLNSLLANSEIRGMVQKELESQGKSAPMSYLCKSLGAGEHNIDALSFSALQAKYLRGRNCAYHSYTFSASESKGQPVEGAKSAR